MRSYFFLVMLMLSLNSYADESIVPIFKRISKVGKTIALVEDPALMYQGQKHYFAPFFSNGYQLINSGAGYCALLFGAGASGDLTSYAFKEDEPVSVLPLDESGRLYTGSSYLGLERPVRATFCYVPEANMQPWLEDILVVKPVKNANGTVTITRDTYVNLPFTLRSADGYGISYRIITSFSPSKMPLHLSNQPFDGVDDGDIVYGSSHSGLSNRSQCKYLGYKEDVSVDTTVITPSDDPTPTLYVLNGKMNGITFSFGFAPYKSLTCK